MSGCSLWVFCGAKTSIKTSMRWSVFFYLSSKRNRKFKHLVQTKPMGENTRANIMKVSIAGTSLKEREKKVWESYYKKNNIQLAEESKDCSFRIYCQCKRAQKHKFPQQLRWSWWRRATMTLFCNRPRPNEIMKTSALRKCKYYI